MWILILVTCNPDCTSEVVETFRTETECVMKMEEIWKENKPHATACLKREEYQA